MAKTQSKVNQRTLKVFQDLEKFKEFTREYGYRFDEADLYSNRSYVWRQYTKLGAGKEVKDQWAVQLERMANGR